MELRSNPTTDDLDSPETEYMRIFSQLNYELDAICRDGLADLASVSIPERLWVQISWPVEY